MAFGPPDGARLRADFLSDDELYAFGLNDQVDGSPNYLLGLNIPRSAPRPLYGNPGWADIAQGQLRPARSPRIWEQVAPKAYPNSGMRPAFAVQEPGSSLLTAPVSYRTGSSPSRYGASPSVASAALQRDLSRPDPRQMDVFQRGPDGKLHPIPGWHTTGPFDFDIWSHNIDWGGTAADLAEIGLGAATFGEGAVLANAIVDRLGYKIGPAIIDGIVQGHHAWPKFMGGPVRQELSTQFKNIHTMFHSDLAAALRQAGFPRIGGKGGSIDDWAAYFQRNADKSDEAIEILRRVTRRFDKRNNTNITPNLERELAKGGGR